MVIARCQQNVLCFIPSFSIWHFIFSFFSYYFLPSFGSALISLVLSSSFSAVKRKLHNATTMNWACGVHIDATSEKDI